MPIVLIDCTTKRGEVQHKKSWIRHFYIVWLARYKQGLLVIDIKYIERLTKWRLSQEKRQAFFDFSTFMAKPYKTKELFCLTYQSQPLYLSRVLHTSRNKVDTGGLNAGMPQDISQSDNIMACTIKNRGKQVPEIMRKHLSRWYTCCTAQFFHLCPYLFSG